MYNKTSFVIAIAKKLVALQNVI